MEETGQSLGAILNQMTHIAEDVTSIADATTAQSLGIGEVNTSMQGLDTITQQVVAMFEETSAETGALKEATRGLRGLLGQFRITVAPRHTASAAVPLRRLA